MKKFLLAATLCFVLAFALIPAAGAHSGGTDANGGHYDHSNGTYHYHNGGRKP